MQQIRRQDCANSLEHACHEVPRRAANMLKDFIDNAELQDHLVQLSGQHFAPGEENATRSLRLVGTAECCFIANTETGAEDTLNGVELLRESLESDTVSQAIWRRFGVTPEDSMMTVKHLQVRDPAVPSTAVSRMLHRCRHSISVLNSRATDPVSGVENATAGHLDTAVV